jgi:hypothetical protein
MFDIVEMFLCEWWWEEHTDHILKECVKKVCMDMTSNLRIQATNAYLKAHGVQVNNFKDHSATFLTIY